MKTQLNRAEIGPKIVKKERKKNEKKQNPYKQSPHQKKDGNFFFFVFFCYQTTKIHTPEPKAEKPIGKGKIF